MIVDIIPRIDVYRKWDMRLMLVGVTAKRAAEYAGVTEGFVWSCAHAKHKVACNTGYVFYFSEGFSYDDRGDPGIVRWKIDRVAIADALKRCGYYSIGTFGRAMHCKDELERLVNEWHTDSPDAMLLGRICLVLGVTMDEIIVYDHFVKGARG